MPIVGLDHVQLAMPAGEEDAATAFYSGLLGLRRVPKPPNLVAAGGVVARTDEPLAGYDRVYVDDPFGNRIELMEPTAR